MHPSCTRQVTPMRVCVMSRLSSGAVRGAAMPHSSLWLHIAQSQFCYLCPSFHVMRAYGGSGGNFGTRVIIFTLQPFVMIPRCVVGIVTALRAGRSAVRIPLRGKSSLLQNDRTSTGVQPTSYLVGTGVFPGGKAAGSGS
jgi:hypothetical protein